MRTTNKEFKKQIQEHILNGLLDQSELLSGYGIETNENNLTQEQLKAVVSEFHNWYGPYEQKRKPNRQEAFIDWMNGLPSCLNTEYTNYGINQTLKTWFENTGTPYKEKDSDKEANLYNGLVYRELNTLLKKNDLSLF